MLNCQEYSLKWINKTAGFVKCFVSGIFADSNIVYARHFNFCPITIFFYKTDTCSCYKIARLCKLQKKRCNRLAVASDKVYQLLAHGRWFSPATPASSTTKTGRHDIAEILLKVVLKHQKIKIMLHNTCILLE